MDLSQYILDPNWKKQRNAAIWRSSLISILVIGGILIIYRLVAHHDAPIIQNLSLLRDDFFNLKDWTWRLPFSLSRWFDLLIGLIFFSLMITLNMPIYKSQIDCLDGAMSFGIGISLVLGLGGMYCFEHGGLIALLALGGLWVLILSLWSGWNYELSLAIPLGSSFILSFGLPAGILGLPVAIISWLILTLVYILGALIVKPLKWTWTKTEGRRDAIKSWLSGEAT